MQITPAEVAETLAMVSKQNLDIRTITLGINLRGCVDADVDALATKVYDRMTSAAENLVPTVEQLEREFGIPIVNKRISVTPIAEICAAVTADDLTPVAVAMDRAGKEVGVDFVGGFSALVHKGATRADHKLMDSIPTALAATDRVCASVNVGSTRAGINMDAAFKMAGIIKRAAELTADKQCIGAGKLVVFCNAVEDNPFMAGAFHGSGRSRRSGERGRVGPRRGARGARRPAQGCRHHYRGRGHQGHRFQDHPCRRAHGPRGLAPPRRAAGHPGFVAGPHPSRGRLRGRDSGSHRRGPVRRPRHHGGARYAERRREEGRRHGVVFGGRPVRRLHPRLRGRRHDPRGRGRGAFHREAGGHDLRVLRGPRHDRRAGRHHRRRPSSASSPTSAPSA